ncbi:hypothetical protein H257_01703 [Aphanomyces astaci]|uniref:Regulator of microtubule dynamics protein 1 n=1 Tax=Aphanomyces astaci TaxID=112090 RepID=W4H5Y7_APHAT|nr:hypothetical protein H257_01703 [Aphanomyces astaci]ETV86533.1 hypothetical protein H257_01703 [Aphanomyces astaci]|eukprot:XP_009823332.1 hypothetical protein H257_01703 [Aphanomyces astaci]
MSWARTVLFAVAAVGVATGTVLVYRYATRGLGGDRPQDEEEIPHIGDTTSRHESQATSPPPTTPLPSDEVHTSAISATESDESLLPTTDERLEMDRLVVQESNMLLSLFGVVFLAIVVVVASVVVLTSHDIPSIMHVEMFPPLFFVGVGIVAASLIHAVNQRSLVSTLPPPLLTDKATPCYDASTPTTPGSGDHPSTSSGSNGSPSWAAKAPSPRRNVTFETDAAAASQPSSSTPLPPAAVAPLPDHAALVAKADELYTQGKFQPVKAFLDENLKYYPQSIDLLWRSARACQDMTTETTDVAATKALVFEGMTFAERAYELRPNDAMTNKWMGIMLSSVGNYRDTSEKIKGAFKIKNFIERSIELNPNDATAHNILGQWCLAFANLGWLEKQAATMLFGRPPTATYEDAVRHFHDAEHVSPGFWKKNVYLLADTYAKMGNVVEAKLWLAKADAVPVKTTEDKEVQAQIETLRNALA